MARDGERNSIWFPPNNADFSFLFPRTRAEWGRSSELSAFRVPRLARVSAPFARPPVIEFPRFDRNFDVFPPSVPGVGPTE